MTDYAVGHGGSLNSLDLFMIILIFLQCLLPLANRPLLDYTLEFLQMSGVHEVFVYCTVFPADVKEYLQSSGWLSESKSTPLKIVVITNEECRSFGDAMRDLDGKGLLRRDFILMHGDTVANFDIKPLLEAHK